jgi:ABC-2 type transport system permease protein
MSSASRGSVPRSVAPVVAVSEWLRPFRAAFESRFTSMLQYRSAALAGFATQCWWGGIKVMILAAFFRGGDAAAPLSLTDAVTYIWLTQALFALLPWLADSEVALNVRTGAIVYDRLRPVDAYGLLYARGLGWLVARALPRAALLVGVTAIGLPLLGAQRWALGAPHGLAAALCFAVSLALAALLSTAVLTLSSAAVIALGTERGVVALLPSSVVVFSGNLLPLSLFPDWLAPLLLLQPFAGLLDIPLRLYTGQASGAPGAALLGLQLAWLVLLVGLGRRAVARAFARLEVHGG